MTTQEFVKKEADVYSEKVSFQVPYNGTNDFYNEERLKTSSTDFTSGLAKGLEIAKEFAECQSSEGLSQKGEKWFDYKGDFKAGDTSELLTIFLTEKYGNNG